MDTHQDDCKGLIQPQPKPGLRIQPCALPDGRYQTKPFGFINRTFTGLGFIIPSPLQMKKLGLRLNGRPEVAPLISNIAHSPSH